MVGVTKATLRDGEASTYILVMDGEIAAVLFSLVGSVGGGGAFRQSMDEIYHAIYKAYAVGNWPNGVGSLFKVTPTLRETKE